MCYDRPSCKRFSRMHSAHVVRFAIFRANWKSFNTNCFQENAYADLVVGAEHIKL